MIDENSNKIINRSSRPEVFSEKGVLRNIAKFTGKYLCQSLFFNKVADLRPATLLKKKLWHNCFSVNFAKFLRTPFVTEHLWRLLLYKALFKVICVQISYYKCLTTCYWVRPLQRGQFQGWCELGPKNDVRYRQMCPVKCPLQRGFLWEFDRHCIRSWRNCPL